MEQKWESLTYHFILVEGLDFDSEDFSEEASHFLSFFFA
jgi:hypothetical protein